MSKLAAALLIVLLAPGLLLVAAVVVRVMLRGFREGKDRVADQDAGDEKPDQ